MNTAPVCQRETVSVYTTNEDEFGVDVYVVFRSGVVMYADEAATYLQALNGSYKWLPSFYGEQHARDIFEFIGYFPAPCKEEI